jgi:tetratricopeptide (TPR) repeat protein
VPRDPKYLIFLIAFCVASTAIFVPMGVATGLFSRAWLSLANLLFLLMAAVMVVGLLSLIAEAPLRYSSSALRRGDYDRALLWLRPLGTFGRRSRGIVLALAGRFPEAETIFRELAGEARNPKAQAAELNTLGDVLTHQGRYDEARDCLDQALQLDVGHGSAWNELATLHLLQHLEPEKALMFVERAMHAQERAALEPAAHSGILAFRLANKAWALACLGRPGEADVAMAESSRLADRRHIPGMALLYWTGGMAFAAMAETAKARHHFQTASELDPNGAYGKLAARSLAGL